MMLDSVTLQPWGDGSEEVVLEKIIPSHMTSHPFEVYFDTPSRGNGHLKFSQEGIQLAYPKVNKGGSSLYWFGDVDGDADFDASDAGCLIGMLVMFGLGYLVKKAWKKSIQDEFEIIWSRKLNIDIIDSIKVTGRTLQISIDLRGKKEYKILFADEDEERLYKELSFHYPQALYT